MNRKYTHWPARWITALGLIAVLVANASLSLAQVAGPVQVLVETVREDVFRDKAEALGTLRANESVELTVNVTETITALHFEDGQRVEANQVLVEMTSAEESAQLQEEQTNVREAKRQLDRIQRLVTAGTASESVLDERQRDYDAAQARLIAVRSRLKDRVVKAPFAGQVGLRNISAGALVRPGDLITTLTDDTRMKLDFTVPAVFLPSLQRALPIVATTRAYREREFRGQVVSIDNQVDPVTRAIAVRAILPNDEQLLRQGMLMQITLFMNERRGLVISEESLLPEGRTNYVMVASPRDDQLIAEKRQVTVASRRRGEVEISQGLAIGERVITHGAFRVQDGSPVLVNAGAGEAAALVKPPTSNP
ncbi:efflux RND transporter periplasmic adaptor subunit [Exilibacterium tricleocarpae]|uniref:Efflux RND transporter periplasmic adaptor subunit n=1 Tax=Exilibacterium tricleocarpae TaxID=2591008 RepID=A0A545TVG2_9GAMM|nr:efflux RND transporter periplasmic adaptor subunit [Exilibacterium tricleocarpae]TQV81208.1 efflux RND transporter periplasmic adaptor subunit [Exilibacterium tricleocarpae]